MEKDRPVTYYCGGCRGTAVPGIGRWIEAPASV